MTDRQSYVRGKKRLVTVVQELSLAHDYRGLLAQICSNLLSNAIKFSSKKSSPLIEDEGRELGDACSYSVRDNGAAPASARCSGPGRERPASRS